MSNTLTPSDTNFINTYHLSNSGTRDDFINDMSEDISEYIGTNYPNYDDNQIDDKSMLLFDAILRLWDARYPDQNPHNQRASALEQLRQEFNIPQISEEQQRLNRLREENPIQENESNLQYQIRIAELAEAEENDKPMGYGECPICMKALTNKKTVVDAHPTKNSYYSGHNCHKDCLLKWCKSKPSCPICRAELDCNSIANNVERVVIIEERLQGGKRKRRKSKSRKSKKSRKEKRRVTKRRRQRNK